MDRLAPTQGVTVSDADVDATIDRRGHDARAPPRLDDRGRADARHRRDHRHRRREGRRQGQGRRGARGPQGGQGLGDRRQEPCPPTPPSDQGGDLAYVDKDAALDPAFSDAMHGGGQGHAHRRRRGRRRHLPHRPGDRHHRAGRGLDADHPGPGRGHQPRPTSAPRPGARRCAASSTTRSSRQRLAPGLQRQVSEIFLQEGQSEGGPQADPRPAHPRTRPTAIRRTPRMSHRAILRGPRPRPRPQPPTTSSRPIPASSTPSPAPRATTASAATTGGKLPYFSAERRHRPGVRGRDLRAGAPARPAPAARASPPSAGT